MNKYEFLAFERFNFQFQMFKCSKTHIVINDSFMVNPFVFNEQYYNFNLRVHWAMKLG